MRITESNDNDKNSLNSSGGDFSFLFHQFAGFLQIKPNDIEIMRRYRKPHSEGAPSFAKVFYDYLFASSPTAQLLEKFQQDGGDIDKLIESQLSHLQAFLDADTDVGYANCQLRVGQIHYQHGIEPVWIMGGYHLYQEHLRELIHAADSKIAQHQRKELECAISKFLFRDIGLMLQGYWESALHQLQDDKQKISRLQEQVSSLLANLPQVLWSVDVINNHPLYISPATREICPLDVEMPIPCLAWTVADDRPCVEKAWQQALAGEKAEIETRVIAPDNTPRWFRREFHPYRDETGQVIRIDGIMEDITEARRTLMRMEHLANTDVLTGLANRTRWYDRLTHGIASSHRHDRQLVLMLLDLNYFKMINDTLGHPAGDLILKQVAQRILQVIRDSDTLARLGGDEFSVLLSEVEDPVKTSKKVADKIVNCLREPFYLEDNDELYLGGSIGIAIYPDHGEDADTLLSHADIAMYTAKRGDSDYLFYDPDSDESTSQQLQMSGRLRRSMERNELDLHYQPKLEMGNGKVCGMEALLRWTTDDAAIPPDHFIPIAEQNGMITPITEWVMQSALTQISHWRESGLNTSVAINISGRSLQSPTLIDRIRVALEKAGVSGDCLEIEITENTLMTDLERGSDMIGRLNDLGVRISIDDFGTGYSSLSYLKRLPIDTVKIDKSFVLDMLDNENDAVIVRSIIDLGHRLGMEVVAEGVENQQTWDLLKEWGCNTAQGYFVSRPANHRVMTNWLSKQKPLLQ